MGQQAQHPASGGNRGTLAQGRARVVSTVQGAAGSGVLMEAVLDSPYAFGYVALKSGVPTSQEIHKLHTFQVKNIVSDFTRARDGIFPWQLKITTDTLQINILSVNVVLITAINV